MGHLWSLIHSPQLHPLKQNGVCETPSQGSVKVCQPPVLPHCREARLCLAFLTKALVVWSQRKSVLCALPLRASRDSPRGPTSTASYQTRTLPLSPCLFCFFFALPLSLFPAPVVMSSARAQGQGEPESNSCPSRGRGGRGERHFFSLSPGFLSCKMGEELEI